MSTTALVRSSSASNALTTTASPSSRAVAQSASSTSIQSRPNASTPTNTTPAKTPTSTPQRPPPSTLATPGIWRHPRMDEVIMRQNRTNFDQSNVYAILYNIAFIMLSFIAPMLLYSIIPSVWAKAAQPYPWYALNLLRLFFLANIGLALAPLFRSKDTCEDIPLSAAQRQLLGLPPLSRPATPQEKEQYVTPPRYSRSATPRSSSSSLRAEISGSPLAGLGGSGSPLSAFPGTQQRPGSGGSPIPRTGSGAERRRLSYNATNRSSPLSLSEFEAAGIVNTPTKSNNRASVGLNSKWLYEKGKARGSPVSAWGNGSVFS